MDNPLLTGAAQSPKILIAFAGPVVDTTGVVVIALVVGGIALATIGAALIKSLGRRAIEKVEPADIPGY